MSSVDFPLPEGPTRLRGLPAIDGKADSLEDMNLARPCLRRT